MKTRGTRNDDRLIGGADPDVIRGLVGDDTIAGRGGDDILFGGKGDDHLNGGAGSDRLMGDDGADRLIDKSNGSDMLYGGGGSDDLELTRQSATSSDIVELHGDDGDDRLVYSGINATGVSATLSGDAGDDVIESNGSASISGGAGDDTITLLRFTVAADVTGGFGDDTVVFEDCFNATSLTANLGTGNDTFRGHACGFRVQGGEGNDTFDLVNARASNLSGGNGNDTISVNNTEDYRVSLDVGAGDDTVIINTTSFQAASHLVTLGTGIDVLELRADNFTFDANVTVTDFDTGRGGDRVRLADYLVASCDGYDGGDPFASGYLRLEQSRSGTLLQIDNNGGADEWRTIVLFENTRASAFREANFADGYDPALMAGLPTFHHVELTPDSATP